MNQSMMTGYAVVVTGIVIVMYAVAAAATGQPMAEQNAGALLSFGGFITAIGFVTAGFWSTESDILRTGLLLVGGATIISMMSLL